MDSNYEWSGNFQHTARYTKAHHNGYWKKSYFPRGQAACPLGIMYYISSCSQYSLCVMLLISGSMNCINYWVSCLIQSKEHRKGDTRHRIGIMGKRRVPSYRGRFSTDGRCMKMTLCSSDHLKDSHRIFHHSFVWARVAHFQGGKEVRSNLNTFLESKNR